MQPEFEVFSGKKTRLEDGPTITIQRRGAFALNQKAMRGLAPSSLMAVLLLFDPERNIVGIRRTELRDEYGYPVVPHTSGHTFIINAPAFFKHYNIDRSQSRVFVAELLEIDGKKVVAADLNKPIAVTTRRANGAKAAAKGQERDDTRSRDLALTTEAV